MADSDDGAEKATKDEVLDFLHDEQLRAIKRFLDRGYDLQYLVAYMVRATPQIRVISVLPGGQVKQISPPMVGEA